MAGQRTPATTLLSRDGVSYRLHTCAGRRGLQLELAPGELVRAAKATVAPIATAQ